MNETEFHIYKSIGPLAGVEPWETVQSADIRSWLSYMAGSGVKKATVRINSGGGNWLEAQSIYAMLANTSLKVDTYNDGIAASSSSFIFQAGKTRYMADYAKLMIHNCAGGAAGGIKDMEKEIESQKAINASMCTIYATRTGLSETEIADMMEKETWLSAEEALAKGFIDEIITTGKKNLAPTAQMATGELQAYYASILPNTENNKSDMKHLIATLAGLGLTLSATATEEQVAETIKTALSNTADKDRADKLAGELETFKTAQVTSLVENAVATGRITADGKAHWEAMAKADFTAASAAINAIPARTKIADKVALGSEGGESRKDWDFEKWSQEDPAGLKTLKISQPEQYTALLNSYTA